MQAFRNARFVKGVFLFVTVFVMLSYGGLKTTRWFRRAGRIRPHTTLATGRESTEENSTPEKPPVPSGGKVAEVIDGDTIVLDTGTKVRYLGIDSPETGNPYSEDASRANQSLVLDRHVDLEPCGVRPRDRYDRVLARVRVEGVDVAASLLRDGLADVMDDADCADSAMLGDYWQAARDAYGARKGIWSGAAAAPLSPEAATGAVRRIAYVCGVVKSVRHGDMATHLNFGADRHTDFSVTVPGADYAAFIADGPLDASRVGRSLLVFGRIHEHEGPAIVARTPRQWTWVDACPKSL